MIAVLKKGVSHNSPATRWRVHVVGQEGQELDLDRDLTRERAEELREMLISCDVFRSIEIEAESDAPRMSEAGMSEARRLS